MSPTVTPSPLLQTAVGLLYRPVLHWETCSLWRQCKQQQRKNLTIVAQIAVAVYIWLGQSCHVTCQSMSRANIPFPPFTFLPARRMSNIGWHHVEPLLTYTSKDWTRVRLV